MPESITLTVSRQMLQLAKAIASVTGESVEDVLIKWLERGSLMDDTSALAANELAQIRNEDEEPDLQ